MLKICLFLCFCCISVPACTVKTVFNNGAGSQAFFFFCSSSIHSRSIRWSTWISIWISVSTVLIGTVMLIIRWWTVKANGSLHIIGMAMSRNVGLWCTSRCLTRRPFWIPIRSILLTTACSFLELQTAVPALLKVILNKYICSDDLILLSWSHATITSRRWLPCDDDISQTHRCHRKFHQRPHLSGSASGCVAG